MRRRAIAIACADPSAAVRACAVQLAAENAITDRAFWLTGLRDRAPLVRRFAARGLRGELLIGASGALLTALGAEESPEAFLAIHDALERALGVELPHGAADTAAAREQICAQWRKLCSEY